MSPAERSRRLAARRPLLGAAALAAAVVAIAGCAGPLDHHSLRSDAAGGPGSGGAAASPAAAHGHGGVPVAGGGVTAVSATATDDGGRELSLPLPGGEYRPQAPSGGTDDYRCFLLDPRVTRSTFLTGAEFVPGNPALVHHAILYRVRPEQVGAAREKDAADARDGWECFGGPSLPGGATGLAALDEAPWLSAWAPGGKPTRFTGGTGVLMPAGTRIVLQVHYNLLGGDGSDTSGVRLRFAAPGTPLRPLETMLLAAPVELPCPPGESGPLCDREAAVFDVIRRFGDSAGRTVAGLHVLCDGDPAAPVPGPTQTCDRRVERPMTIVAAAGHMHLLGRSIRVELNPGRPGSRVLLDKPVWDFDDQGAVKLSRPQPVKAGDVLRLRCTHDAALRSMLPALKGQQPRYVVWGEGTSDEMCLGVLAVLRG